MAGSIAATILVVSLMGMLIMVFRKFSVLAELPTVAEQELEGNFRQRLKERLKRLPGVKHIYSGIFFQKILSKIRILTLKIDSKTGNLLQKLREKSQKKDVLEKDNYWQELKESTNQAKDKTKKEIKPE